MKDAVCFVLIFISPYRVSPKINASAAPMPASVKAPVDKASRMVAASDSRMIIPTSVDRAPRMVAASDSRMIVSIP